MRKQTRVKVTYVAIDKDGPILTSASTFEDLRLALDEYYGVGKEKANCLGFTPYSSKYGDSFEGSYKYEFEFNGQMITDIVQIYCVEYYPHTVYELEFHHQAWILGLMTELYYICTISQ